MEKVVKKSAYETSQTDIVLIQTEGCIALSDMDKNTIFEETF